jgi:hypothetical protein
MNNSEISRMVTSELTASIRDLILHLHRGNDARAEVLVDMVSRKLKGIVESGGDPASFHMNRAQQTLFAIDEVRLLLAERDMSGALSAARDAGKEWSQKPKQEPLGN